MDREAARYPARPEQNRSRTDQGSGRETGPAGRLRLAASKPFEFRGLEHRRPHGFEADRNAVKLDGSPEGKGRTKVLVEIARQVITNAQRPAPGQSRSRSLSSCFDLPACSTSTSARGGTPGRIVDELRKRSEKAGNSHLNACFRFAGILHDQSPGSMLLVVEETNARLR